MEYLEKVIFKIKKVYKAKDIKTNEIVAMKKISLKKCKEGVKK
jgi:hypothetical protein